MKITDTSYALRSQRSVYDERTPFKLHGLENAAAEHEKNKLKNNNNHPAKAEGKDRDTVTIGAASMEQVKAVSYTRAAGGIRAFTGHSRDTMLVGAGAEVAVNQQVTGVVVNSLGGQEGGDRLRMNVQIHDNSRDTMIVGAGAEVAVNQQVTGMVVNSLVDDKSQRHPNGLENHREKDEEEDPKAIAGTARREKSSNLDIQSVIELKERFSILRDKRKAGLLQQGGDIEQQGKRHTVVKEFGKKLVGQRGAAHLNSSTPENIMPTDSKNAKTRSTAADVYEQAQHRPEEGKKEKGEKKQVAVYA